jgi:DnaK suppressor protein
MKKSDLKRLRKVLEEKRAAVIARARATIAEDMTLDSNELPDEMDLASSEYIQSFTFRLRGRERMFLQKIEKALKKMDEDVFGICESCEEPINLKRLEARPETELCIRCKEDQERMEKDFGT